MLQPMHYNEMKGSVKLWLRHHAEFLPNNGLNLKANSISEFTSPTFITKMVEAEIDLGGGIRNTSTIWI